MEVECFRVLVAAFVLLMRLPKQRKCQSSTEKNWGGIYVNPYTFVGLAYKSIYKMTISKDRDII